MAQAGCGTPRFRQSSNPPGRSLLHLKSGPAKTRALQSAGFLSRDGYPTSTVMRPSDTGSSTMAGRVPFSGEWFRLLAHAATHHSVLSLGAGFSLGLRRGKWAVMARLSQRSTRVQPSLGFAGLDRSAAAGTTCDDGHATGWTHLALT